MYSFNSEHKTTTKRIIAGIALLLAAALLVTLICVCALNSREGKGQLESQTQTTDGMVVSGISAKGLSVRAMATTLSEDSSGDSTPAMADSAYTLVVTPEPVTADDTYTWSATNTADILLAPSSDTKSCTVTCKNAFRQQITVTVKSETNTYVSATCTLDYLKPVTSVTVTAPQTITFGTSSTAHTVKITPVYGVGTITPDTLTITGGSLQKNVAATTSVSNTVGNSDGTTTIHIRRATLGDFTFSGATFNMTTPAAAFIKSSSVTSTEGGLILQNMSDTVEESTVQPLVAPDLGIPTSAQLNDAFNNSFKLNVKGTDDGVLTVNYTYGHGGTTVGSGTATLSVGFDCSSMLTNAVTATLNDGQVIFY